MSKKTETLENKALFIQRLVAFVLDILIITFVTSLIATPFVDLEKSNKLSNQSTEVMQKYIDIEIDTKTYSIEFMNISYKLARNNGILSFITIILEILYFVVFQIYRNGQTLGKMLMKIKIVSDNGELNMNQMIFRSLITNSILLNIITEIFSIIFLSKWIKS